MATNSNTDKSLESWIWDAACSIRGAKDAPKYKEYILPLIFAKRLCDVFDDELNRIAKEVGSRTKAFKLVKRDKKLVRFFLPLEPKNPDDPVWSVIRTGKDAQRPPEDKYQEKLGQELTTYLRAIADENSLLKGIIETVIHVFKKDRAFEVEFLTLYGKTVAIVTLDAAKIRLVRKREITHARLLRA